MKKAIKKIFIITVSLILLSILAVSISAIDIDSVYDEKMGLLDDLRDIKRPHLSVVRQAKGDRVHPSVSGNDQ